MRIFNFYEMWTVCSFTLVLFCTALSKSHPGTTQENSSSNLRPTVNESEPPGNTKNQTDDSRTALELIQTNSSDAHRSLAQSLQRPRFLVTYENVYKPSQPFMSPVDPFQNILLYFLMNFGREMSGLEENKLRRPVDFTTDPRNKITAPNKEMKHSLSHEMLEDEQNEVHFFPHVDGTCMCFNRRQIQKKELRAKALKQPHEQGYCRFHTKTTELKTENHNVPSSNDTEKSTIAVHNNNETSNNNNTIIKVLRLARHNNTSNTQVSTKVTTAKSDVTKEEIVITGEEVDLQLLPDNDKADKHIRKKKFKEEKAAFTSSVTGNIQHTTTNTNKSKHDEGYYFLSFSGGTDQRTTAPNKLTIHLPDTNTIHIEDKKLVLQKRTRETKKRRKRVRKHLEKIEKYLHDSLKLHPIRKLRKNDNKISNQTVLRFTTTSKGNNHTDPSNELAQKEELERAVVNNYNKDIMMMLPIARMEEELDKKTDLNGVTNLKSVEEIIKYHNWAPFETDHKLQQPLPYSSSIPTVLGIGTIFIIIGYVMKTKGWCYNLGSHKSNPVTTEANVSAKETKT